MLTTARPYAPMDAGAKTGGSSLYDPAIIYTAYTLPHRLEHDGLSVPNYGEWPTGWYKRTGGPQEDHGDLAIRARTAKLPVRKLARLLGWNYSTTKDRLNGRLRMGPEEAQAMTAEIEKWERAL